MFSLRGAVIVPSLCYFMIFLNFDLNKAQYVSLLRGRGYFFVHCAKLNMPQRKCESLNDQC